VAEARDLLSSLGVRVEGERAAALLLEAGATRDDAGRIRKG